MVLCTKQRLVSISCYGKSFLRIHVENVFKRVLGSLKFYNVYFGRVALLNTYRYLPQRVMVTFKHKLIRSIPLIGHMRLLKTESHPSKDFSVHFNICTKRPLSLHLLHCHLPPPQPSTLSLKARHTTAFWWPLYSLLISPVSTHHRRARLSDDAVTIY